MKLSTTILYSLVLFFFLASCRHDSIPEDIHEHEEVELVNLELIEKGNETNKQLIQYIGGKADKAIALEAGKTYDVKLDFLHAHDDHFHSMLEEIVEEKDEHFITYSFAGVELELVRTGTDVVRTDGQRLGVNTEWKILSKSGEGKVAIQLYHGSSSVEANVPSEKLQLGKVTGGSADVNMQININ